MKKVILLSCLLFLSSTSPALPAEPKAILTGPASVQSGTDIVLHFTGSITDSLTYLKVQSAPVDPLSVSCSIAYIKDSKGNYGSPFGLAKANIPGTYTFLFVVSGTPAGSDLPAFDSASLSVQVVAPGPAPSPEPPPAPIPPPVPVPPAYAGKLWAVLALPDSLTVDLATLRTDPAIRSAMAERSISFESHRLSDAELQAPTWQANITHFGGPPVVLWMNEDKKIVAATRSMNTIDIIADAKKIRGK